MVDFKPGWLERDVARASKRATDLRSQESKAAEARLDNAIADAFTNNDPLSIWFEVRVYLSEVQGRDTAPSPPDSALRQALVAAEVALAPFAHEASLYQASPDELKTGQPYLSNLQVGDLRRAREAHALITEALQRKE